MKLVNLTPHKLNIVTDNGNIEIEPSGTIARVKPTTVRIGTVNGIDVVKTTFGEVEGLPSPEKDTVYIVSTLVLNALKGSRPDVVAPDTGPESAIRDESGRIVGIRRFQII